MRYPMLNALKTSRDMVDVFGGYNHNLRISDSEFYDMKNMTSDYYPLLAPRNSRRWYSNPMDSIQGMIAKDNLCYVDGDKFVINGYSVSMGLSKAAADCPKQLISIGAYVIILPDKKYINTKDLTDFGNIEASYASGANTVTVEPCNINGEVYMDVTVSPTEPEDPSDQDVWMNPDGNTMSRYSSSASMWVTIPSTYVKITCPGIGAAFEKYDGVTISVNVDGDLKQLEGNTVLYGADTDSIVVVGLIGECEYTVGGEDGVQSDIITVERRMPVMDFVTESENRLWGCRYGVAANGDVVNELYACKLGDFKNWNCFMGLSTDSYVATCGTDGQFTGAITHLGYPLFFKENYVHKVYGNYPANFQIQTTACRGVEKGSHKSLAIVNEVLYYKARHAVCAYDGSLPMEISSCMGDERYSDAVGGAHGNKYYVSMKDTAGAYHLFVHDTARGLWHREDNLMVKEFCSCGDSMYCIDNQGRIITVAGPAGYHSISDDEYLKWMVQTGVISTAMPDMKYVSRMTVRMSLTLGARVRFLIQYDSLGGWEHIATMVGTSLRSFTVPIRPRRCDHFRLRIEGDGEARIYSITKTIEQGSDVS